jgi:sulfur carrier protein
MEPTWIDILLNGEPRRLPGEGRIADLLHAEGLAERRVAVEVNGAIVPRGQHPTHRLQPGDQVEIVHALGGG